MKHYAVNATTGDILASNPQLPSLIDAYADEAGYGDFRKPDIASYLKAEEQGLLTFFSVLDCTDGSPSLAGFAALALLPNRQTGTLQAVIDAIYVKPEHRPQAGALLIGAIRRAAKAKGIKRLYLSATRGTHLFTELASRPSRFTEQSTTFTMET